MTRAIVLDAAGFFSGYASMISKDKVFTVREVIDEIKDPWSRAIYENAASAYRVSIVEPSGESIEKALKAALEEDLVEALSDADKKLLALAIDLKERGYDVLLITDDSYLHRLARKLGVESRGARRSTPRSFKPRLYFCEVCGYKTRKRVEACPQCGSRVSVLE